MAKQPEDYPPTTAKPPENFDMAEGQRRANQPVMVTAGELELVLERGGELERASAAAKARAGRVQAKEGSEREKIIVSIVEAHCGEKVIRVATLVNDELRNRGMEPVSEKTVQRRMRTARKSMAGSR